jgi:hypothetical protein
MKRLNMKRITLLIFALLLLIVPAQLRGQPAKDAKKPSILFLFELPVKNQAPEKIDLTGKTRVPGQWQPDWIVKKYFEVPAKSDK